MGLNPWEYPTWYVTSIPRSDPLSPDPISSTPPRREEYEITYETLRFEKNGVWHEGVCSLVRGPTGTQWRSGFFHTRKEAWTAAMTIIDGREKLIGRPIGER